MERKLSVPWLTNGEVLARLTQVVNQHKRYPRRARDMGAEGTVTLGIDPACNDGAVADAICLGEPMIRVFRIVRILVISPTTPVEQMLLAITLGCTAEEESKKKQRLSNDGFRHWKAFRSMAECETS